MHQDWPGSVQVLLATDADFPADGAGRVRTAVRKRRASDDRIDIERVGDIEPASSGKCRPVVGKLAERLRQGGR